MRSAAALLVLTLTGVSDVCGSLTEYDNAIQADASAGTMPASRLTNAATFNGTNSVTFNFGTISGDGTFEFIVEGSPATGNGYLAVGTNNSSNLRFEQYSNTGQLGMTQLGVADYLFNPPVNTPESVAHIAYVWNGTGTMKLYVNGVLAGTNASVSTSFALPSGTGKLGANPSNGEGMVGTVYRMTCYNSALPDAVLLRHAEAYHGVQSAPTITSFTAAPPAAVAGSPVKLTWSVTGARTVSLNGADVSSQTQATFNQTATTSYTLTAANENGYTSRTVEVVTPETAGHIVINEFMAENKSTLADDDGDYSDWLELYNPTEEPLSLAGLFLTDDASSPRKWSLPHVELAAGAYRIVFLSGKNRVPETGVWHANFKLGKTGEYLALNSDEGALQEFAPAFPAQDEDVSFGLTGADPAFAGFMGIASPGSMNDTAPPVPAKVVFSRPDGLFTEAFELSLSSATPGALIYYRLNNAAPVVYTVPVPVSAGAQVRAWAERYGQRSGETRASWIKLSGEMISYTSPLPVMVIDNFASGPIPQKGWSGNGSGVQQVPQQAASWAVWERSGTATTLSGPPQMTSQISIRGRGAFSSSWRQKPYSVEAVNRSGEEKEVSVLGMPEHSDWILYFPDPDSNKDHTLLFNTFVYELSKRLGRYAPRFRWVELFVNEDGGDLSVTDRRGLYLVLEKVARGKDRLDFERLSDDGTTGGWITNINRMDAIPVGGWPAANGATSPQFFRTAGPNRIQQTSPNVSSVAGDDIPQQSNGFLNFDNPNGYTVTPVQRAAIVGWYRTFEDTLYNGVTWRDPVNGYRRYLDERDFAEYFIFNDLTKNGDGMLISMYPWKGKDGRLRMGPTWDYNWSSYYVGGSPTGSLRWRSDQLWYPRLFSDPDFMQTYIDRWFAFRRGALSNAGMESVINSQAAEITSAKAVQQGIPSAAEWQNRLTSMKSWLRQRADWMDTQYVRPPVFSVPSGIVPAGQQVLLSAPVGAIYHTQNGIDPRMPGGVIAASAVTGNTVIIETDMKLTARSLNGNSLGGSPWGAPTSAVYVTDAVAASSSNLAVSEIHYHPSGVTPAEAAAGFTDDGLFEFIEIRNFSDKKISLAGVRFATDATGAGIAFEFDNGGIWSLAAGQRVVVVKNTAAFALRYGSVIIPAGSFEGNLANEGDTVTLLAADGSVISTVSYGEGHPWPDAADGAGYSLTSAAPGAATANPADWRSSLIAGGSPGSGDGIPYTGGSVLDYALAGSFPEWTRTDGKVLVSQKRVAGADAVALSLEYSADLYAWFTAPAATTGEVRTADGSVLLQCTVPDGPRRYFRVRASLRPVP